MLFSIFNALTFMEYINSRSLHSVRFYFANFIILNPTTTPTKMLYYFNQSSSQIYNSVSKFLLKFSQAIYCFNLYLDCIQQSTTIFFSVFVLDEVFLFSTVICTTQTS